MKRQHNCIEIWAIYQIMIDLSKKRMKNMESNQMKGN